MKIILDTNIWVSALFGKHLRDVAGLLGRQDIEVFVGKQLLTELQDVVCRDKIRKYISAESLDAMWDVIEDYCSWVETEEAAQTEVRDRKDVYLLSMADAVQADFLVSGDKDLLVLGKHNGTSIITFSELRQILQALHNEAL